MDRPLPDRMDPAAIRYLLTAGEASRRCSLRPLAPAAPGWPRTAAAAGLLPGLASHLLPGGPEVLSLEPGAAAPDLEILEALRAAGRRPRYQAVGLAATRVEEAVRAAAGRGFAARGIIADVLDPAHLDAIQAPPGTAARLVLCLGALDAGEPVVAAELRRLLRRGDRLLAPGGARAVLTAVAALELAVEGPPDLWRPAA